MNIDIQVLLEKIQAAIDCAVINDHRLVPNFGKLKGEPAVRIGDLEAAIDGAPSYVCDGAINTPGKVDELIKALENTAFLFGASRNNSCGNRTIVQELQEKCRIARERLRAAIAPNTLASIAAMHGTVHDDVVIQFAQAAEQLRAVKIAESVAAMEIGMIKDDMPTPFQSGFHMACEEIMHRLRTEEWDLCLTPYGESKNG